MKKIKKLVFFFALFFSISLVTNQKVLADSGIYSIDVKADIQDDGSVIITDERKIWANSGTEHFISLGNLKDMEVVDFKVEEEGVDFTFDENYDINASLEAKRGRYGYNYNGDEIELCFGIGSYGEHNFKITYKISNFVMKTSDGYPFVYWTFYNRDIGNTDHVNVILTKDGKTFNTENSRIWGFGFNGESKIEENGLSLDSGGKLNKNNQMVMLAIFEKDFLPANNNYELSKEELINTALEGSSYNLDNALGKEDSYPEDYDHGEFDADYGGYNYRNSFFDFSNILFFFPFFIIFPAIIAKIIKGGKKKEFMPEDKSKHYPEIPYYSDFDDFFVDTAFFTDNQGFMRKNWVSAYFLKWIQDGAIYQETREKGLIFKKDAVVFRLNLDKKENMSEAERMLFNMVAAASGSDLVLDENEFKNYSVNHQNKLISFENKVLFESKED